MPISEWADMMPHTVTYEALKSRDKYGKPSYATAVSYAARVKDRTKSVPSRVVPGQDEVSHSEVWIGGIITNIRTDDRFTLPDGSTPSIIDWLVVPDEDGDHHTKVFFGATRGSAGG